MDSLKKTIVEAELALADMKAIEKGLRDLRLLCGLPEDALPVEILQTCVGQLSELNNFKINVTASLNALTSKIGKQ